MKITLEQVPPFSLAFIRMLAASLILAVFIFKKIRIEKSDLKTFIFAAITGVFLNLTFFFFGLRLTEAINAAFLVAAVPILTIFAAHSFLREKLTPKLLTASAIAFIGVALI